MKTRRAARMATLIPTRLLAGACTAVALLTAAPTLASAQDVGYLPDESPYQDLAHRQEFTFFTGFYAPSKDPAGVAPTSAPMFGLRYEIRLGGPAQFYVNLAGSRTDRTVLDPTKGPEDRVLGVQDVNLLMADLGIGINLTGQKSWHGLVPTIAGGLGIASDMTGKDPGTFRLGTPFALSFGGGVKWVSSGRLGLRVDVTDHLFQVRYPDGYYQPPAAGVEPILAPTAKQNVWTHNAALTLGVIYQFGR